MGPLQDVKIIDLTMLLPGPLATMYLGDMGADVIKIENPKIGDGTRYHQGVDQESYLYQLVNRNKKGITLNIKREQGRALLFKLLADADVLVEGFRPGAMAKMGLDFETLHKVFPRLIYCSISGYGANGPYRDLAGHDANYISFAGLLGQIGTIDSGPVIPGVQIADIAGGTLSAVSSILAALYAREKSGNGQYLDVSMMDGAFALQHLLLGDYLSKGKMPQRGNWILSGGLPNYHIYQTKDSRYLVLAALEERFFRNFLTKCGLANYSKADLHDPQIQTELEERVHDLFASQNFDYWQQFFLDPDLCLSPVNTLEDALQDPQLRSRQMVIDLDHPRLGKIMQIGSPFSFSETPVSYRLPAPDQGQHNEEVYEQLGLSKEEMADLHKNRII